MEIMIANKMTGEVVAAYCPSGFKAIKGYIRRWLRNDFLESDQLEILKASTEKVRKYYQEYMYGIEADMLVLVDEDEMPQTVKCLNCSHEQEVKQVYEDRLGKFTVCEDCESSFDI